MMRVPRENVRLGAEWIQGVGQNGEGVDAANVTTNRSVDFASLTKSTQASLNLAVLQYLGLDASYLDDVTVAYSNLVILTVADLSKTSVRTGQSIIYEALKSERISLEGSRGITAKLSATVQGVVTSAEVNNRTRISFSGRDLTFAFRVFELGRSRVSEKVARIKDADRNFRELKVWDYEFEFDILGIVPRSLRVVQPAA